MADSSKPSDKQTLYPANSIPTARELVGLIESFIQGEIELKFAYFLSGGDYLGDYQRQHRAEANLEVLRDELINKLTEVTGLVSYSPDTNNSVNNPPHEGEDGSV